MGRLNKISARLEKAPFDGLLISSPANISYLLGFTARDAYLLLSKRTAVYFTDSRYSEEARQPLRGLASLRQITGNAFKDIADTCASLKLKRVAFEERCLPFARYKLLKTELRRANKGALIPSYGLIEESRMVKEPEEIEHIRKALKITLKALDFIRGFIRPGITELDIAGELERFIRQAGGRGPAFDIIVAFGPNSSRPHHLTGSRKLKKDEPALIDLGVDYNGYKSDLTRVFFLGKMSVTAKRIYDTVRRAQENAIERIQPAVEAGSIDAAARQYITQKGYGGFFGHNTGHGVGLEIHEEPKISRDSKTRIKPGMVFTVEPGIYLPGKFGIRLEEMVLTTEKGCEVISGALNK